jgi:AP-3 complex subunit mu
VQHDAPPLLIIEFLYRVVDVFTDYFENVTEAVIKENFLVVYQVSSFFRPFLSREFSFIAL